MTINNHVTITGSAETLSSLLNAVRNGENCFSFQKIIPCPMEQKDSSEWRRNNWGTTSDAQDTSILVCGNTASLTFETVWDSPRPVIQALSEKYPTLSFDHKYCDVGLAYAEEIYKDGNRFVYTPISNEEAEAKGIFFENGAYFLEDYENAVEDYGAEAVDYAIELFRKYGLIDDKKINA